MQNLVQLNLSPIEQKRNTTIFLVEREIDMDGRQYFMYYNDKATTWIEWFTFSVYMQMVNCLLYEMQEIVSNL